MGKVYEEAMRIYRSVYVAIGEQHLTGDDHLEMKDVFTSCERYTISSAAERLRAWQKIAQARGGACNEIRMSEAVYVFDLNPVRQADGTLRGRCYLQRKGKGLADIGGYKIRKDGYVLWLIPELRGALGVPADMDPWHSMKPTEGNAP